MQNERKINKEYVLSDSSVNDFGFRLLTSGYQIAEYIKNPIGYYMHKRDDGVLVRWDEVAIKGDTIVGTPCVNLNNPRGQQTADEIEGGFLNAASMGHFVILEVSDDPILKLTGQTGPTITKWYNRECSLVDIGSNSNALTQLFDKDGNPVTLASLRAGTVNVNYIAAPDNSKFPKQLFSTDAEIKNTSVLVAALNANYDVYAACLIRRYGTGASFDRTRVNWPRLASYMDELCRVNLANEGAKSNYDEIQKKYFQQELHNDALNRNTYKPEPVNYDEAQRHTLGPTWRDNTTPRPKPKPAPDYDTAQKQSAFKQDLNNSALENTDYKHTPVDYEQAQKQSFVHQVLQKDLKALSTKELIDVMKCDYSLYAAIVSIRNGNMQGIDTARVNNTQLQSYVSQHKNLRLQSMSSMSVGELSSKNLLSELKELSPQLFAQKMNKK